MKSLKFIAVIAVLFSCVYGYAQERKYSTFYYQRASLFEELPIGKKDIIFLGNSITNGAEWFELLGGNKFVKNRGISGDICEGVYDRLDPILKGKPQKIFLMIGINDIGRGGSVEQVIDGTSKIINKIKADSPRTKIYVQSLLPVTDHYGMFSGHTSRGLIIKKVNEELETNSKYWGVKYIDLYSHFIDPNTGKLNTLYSNDGLHLLGVGYKHWVKLLKPYI